ncbi:MAG: sensor histidine kinase [Gammaproteobacteria bacterium]|nr:HAMP domain-containing histidine kinase [Sideroxydans sp.]MBU3903710.1 sensor histidine kinase [Gammaproteobacteria bacterium]MBU4045608.1 sensor histidine kinase [Gammaproteobacteria bacterium]MBU4150170.1 sensor histidine kinase [Gammaproteobacteria bacterium]
MHSSLLASQTGHSHLRRLFMLRNWAILAQLATLILVHRFLSTDLAWLPMLSTVGVLTLANALTWWRLSRDYPVSHLELFVQLTLDVTILSVLLYYAGGSTNPFISLYLLPLVLAAAILPRRYTWGMATLTLACYSLLMVWYVPLPTGDAHAQHTPAMTQIAPDQHAGHDDPDFCRTESEPVAAAASDTSPLGDAFNTHVIGMWLGFLISAAVIAYFAVEMAAAVRLRDAQLNRVREDTLRNERIVALGTLAAGAAHELGTPLSTMAVVIGEMRDECEIPEQKENLNLLDDQVKNCKRILDTLIRHAQETPDEVDVVSFLHDVLDEWQLLRPTVHYHYQIDGAQPAPRMSADPALRAALLNLLNNAADASPDEMDILLYWNDERTVLEIRDHGPGLTPEAAERAGAAFFTTKAEGRGLGLFLANATLERLGGSVQLSNREGGGATTEVILPRAKVNT